MTTTTKSKKVTTRTTPARRAQSPVISGEQEHNATTKAEAASTEARALPDPAIVAALAYRFFEESGHAHGRDQEHWFRAEAILSRN